MPGTATPSNPALRFLLGLPVPWVFVGTYLVGVGLQFAVPFDVHLKDVFAVAGGVLFAVGAAFAGWAWVLFRRAGTTRVPGEVSTQLVTRGPYRVSRNPMYVGLAVAYLGEAGLLDQTWPVITLPLMLAYLNWVVIPLEETRLRDIFGSEFDRYRARVRRWL